MATSAEDLLALAFQCAALKARKERNQTGEVWFTEIPTRLHRALKDIRDRYKDVLPELAELSFSREGAFPYSPEVRQILGNLQLDGVIGRQNPSFDRFSPKVYTDTPQVVEEELQDLFGSSDVRRSAFDALVGDISRDLLVAA